jgi:DNA mismatch repair ATPase MutS
LRLKLLVNITEASHQVFIILDEILKGTNSTDKLNGSKRFLTRLLQLPVSGLVATHDLELGRLEKEYPLNFKNTCFEITIDGNEIDYNYKLKSGISKNMNATLLMESMELI